jgi:2-keto-4-pentenoate hydratase/2-oxohepta-3-ene-1,7-dioic acid hydratase in catechol pathway
LKKYHIKKRNGDQVLVRNIYCIGRNYNAHIKELNNTKPKEPFFFQKSLPALNTTNRIYLSKNEETQYEVEIVLLIGKSGISTSTQDSMSFIGGYSLGIDLTKRNYQTQLKNDKLPWLLSKSFLGSAVVSDFTDQPIEEDFWLNLNGKKKQKGNSKQMISSFGEQIHFLSNKIPLMKGDLIFTGTPKGVGPLKVGDKIEIGFGNTTLNKLSVLD